MPLAFTLKFINLRTGEECKKPDCSFVLALGNFDGVHIGHKTLMRKAVAKAKELSKNNNVHSGFWCFSKPPYDYLSSNPPGSICSLEDKFRLASKCGVEYAVIGNFPELRNLNCPEFIDLLRKDCQCIGTVCGFNFRFGKNGGGTPKTLDEAFGKKAFTVDAVNLDGYPVSSSRIREALLSGDVEKAAQMLGHPFSISGEVIHGKELGQKLGFPTANMQISGNTIIPAKGIYASICEIDKKHYKAVSNIGCRPTVDRDGLSNCETHIIDFSSDIYGKKIRVNLMKKLRDEKKFSSTKELCHAINNDIQQAKEYFLKLKEKEGEGEFVELGI